MPRECRLEYPGACYHVLNRGTNREHVFAGDGAQRAFVECLFEACRISGVRFQPSTPASLCGVTSPGPVLCPIPLI